MFAHFIYLALNLHFVTVVVVQVGVVLFRDVRRFIRQVLCLTDELWRGTVACESLAHTTFNTGYREGI